MQQVITHVWNETLILQITVLVNLQDAIFAIAVLDYTW